MNKIKVSIVIPVFNGEHSIGRLVKELIAALGDLYYLEIVLVNDNSPDNSENVCISLYHEHPHIVRFYSLARNVGEHNAVMAGLNQATGDYMAIMDDDFQNPISEVVKLLDYATRSDCDVTYSYYKKKQHSLFRNIGSWFNDKVANFMLDKPKDLYLSSFKVLNRFITDEIIKYELPYPYIDGLILRTTDKIAAIAVDHHERRAGRSGYTLRKLIRLWLNMFTNFSILPLRVSFIIGVLTSGLGLIFAAITLIEKFSNPNMPVGYASVIVAVLIFAGLQLVSIGVIGEYVGRIFLSQNRKPQYTIRKRFDYKDNKDNSSNNNNNNNPV
ncbi:MAG: glycosyltransferase family 2 protein [Acidobacteria bacterium]|nr:glycosyltransferase family 2 protein [Acidobacteriota bacterium]